MVITKLATTVSLAASVLLFSPVSKATDFDVSHLASELYRVSGELAERLRNARGYGSVRFSAKQLSREAGQLVKVIGRGRSLGVQQAEFRDVARHYRELEAAFLRASPEHDRVVYNHVGVISNLFTSLNSEFYYTNYVEPAPQRYYYVPPVVRRSRPISPYRGRSIGQGGGADAVGGFGGRQNGSRNQRPGYRPNTVHIPYNNFSHRSPVLERQQQHQLQLNPSAGVLLPRYRGQ